MRYINRCSTYGEPRGATLVCLAVIVGLIGSAAGVLIGLGVNCLMSH